MTEKRILFIFITLIALLVILSPINASDLNQSSTLETATENNTILTAGGTIYSDQVGDAGDEDYYNFRNDPTIGRASGVYYGPYLEPAIVISQFNISLGSINPDNTVKIDVTFDGVIHSNIFTLDRYPLTVRENNNKIGTISPESVSNTDYPTDEKTSYTFTTSFNYALKNYDTYLKLRLCGFESNTLVFHYLDTVPATALNENSIVIRNKDKTYTSNSTWINTMDYLEKAINLAEDNSTIYLNNIELYSNKALSINKNITLIGNNAILNGFKSSNLFTVNSNVKFINITFTNTSDYMLNINNDCIIINCTFKDSNPKIINNNAYLKIINSTFKDMDLLAEIEDYATSTVIFNQNNLEIINSTFANITLANTAALNNKIINTSYIIYNLDESILNIYNTGFDNNHARILNNNGKTNLNHTNITNTILSPNIFKITSINKAINNNHVLKSSFEDSAVVETILGEIYNSNELNITDCYFENITWNYQKGLIYDLPTGEKYTWYIVLKPYYKIIGFYTDRTTSFLNKAGAIYNSGKIAIDKTTFNNFKATYSGIIENDGILTINNTVLNNSNSERDGGAIISRKTLNVSNSIFNHNVASGSYYGNGGAIYNTRNASISSVNFTNSEGAFGQAIYNKGNINVNNSIFDKAKDSSIFNYNGGVLYNHEDGNFIIFNTVIKNSRFKQGSSWPTSFYGVVINEGNMIISRTVFDNNTPISPQNIVGTYNLYNNGKMNATYNIFINTLRAQSETTHIYAMNSGEELYMNYNYFDYNKDPYKIHTSMDVNRFFVLSLEPDYLSLDINGTATLNVYLKLDNGKFYTDYSKLPEMNITINVDGKNITKTLIDGKASININNTQNKGTKYITAYYGDWSQRVQIDVGKENSSLIFEADEIYYGDDAVFNMTVTGNYTHQPEGNITIIIDGREYTTSIKNTKARFVISDLIPKTYDLIIRYEGDEDYSKAIHHQNYTVYKKPTNMSIIIPEVYYGETGKITVNLTPSAVSTQAYAYITDESNKTTRKTVYVRDGAELPLKNYAAGEYSITIVLWDNAKYESSNATAIFKVKKYETSLTINASDINAGETEYLNITLSPKGEVAGEAILQINNLTQKIFLKNGLNTVKIENLTGGIYHITVTFPGDKKYAPSNATAAFTVMKIQTNITVKLENGILYINTTQNSTGKVIIYVNDDIYEINLTDSRITFPIKFTKAENSIFIYYQGDDIHNYTTYNLTYEYEELLNLTGYDLTYYIEKNGTYYITLTDEKGYGLTNKTITLTLNSRKYTVVTGNDGIASLNINLNPGKYTITAQYRNKTATNMITVMEETVLKGNDVKAYENTNFIYSVILTNKNGKAIANVEVTFKINGKTYTNKTDSNGQAAVTLNLKEGNYTITSIYENTINTNKLEIVENHILIGQNIRAYENTDFTYTITLTKTDGTPVSNQTITFVINNRRYTDITDSQGKARKTLNLPEGNYTITAIYKETKITNNLTVINGNTLEGNNIRAYSEKDFQYKVNLSNPIKNAEITFTINNQTYKNRTDSNGQAIITLNLKKGNYTITATYQNIKTTNRLEIIDTYQITGINVKSYENFDFEYIATLTNHNSKAISNQKITFTINGKTYTNTTDRNGQAKITLNLKKGNYTITATYNDVKTTNLLEIIAYDLEKIESSDIEMYYHDGTRFKIRLTDNNNSPLVNRTIEITINGVKYTKATNNNGSASIPLGLNSGTYTITTKYNNLIKNNTVTINPTVTGNDLTKVFKNATQYSATFYNSKGELLKNTEITFNINGVLYKRTTKENGIARLNINLPQGRYTITATNPATSEQHTNTITVIPTIQENHDLTKYYRNSSQYRVKVIDQQGNPVKAGEKVTFNINGVLYTRTTNANGYAQLNINLQPGTYTITAEYNGCRIANKITVLPVLSASDIRMKYLNGTQFKATLVNGQGNPDANKQVTFNINGVLYTRTTNNDGIAKLNLKLQPGEYIITSTYNGVNIANTVKIED